MNYKSAICSCITCHEIKSAKGIFSHYLHNHGTQEEKSRMKRGNNNHTDGRHKTNKLYAKNRRDAYDLSPKLCKNCDKPVLYEKQRNKFCSSSCSTTYNNVNHKPNRKFGPDKTKIEKPKKVKKIKQPKVIKEKVIKSKIIPWKDTVIGPFSKIYSCWCMHCDTKFLARKKARYCNLHRDLYILSRSRYQFTFNVYNYPEIFDLFLIKEYGWYSPGNRGPKNNNGVSRDHKVSVHDALKNDYDPFYITHPLNCELMLHSDNKKKYYRSSLTYEELIILVDEYELARGSGNDPHPLHQQTSNLADCA